MKVLALALLVIFVSTLSLNSAHDGSRRPDTDYPELNNDWVLEFDHASRNGVAQDSNRFIVEFNGHTIQEWSPTDYNIHHERFTVSSRVGRNSINFIGSGRSDGLGQNLDNVKLVRKSFCGVEDVIVNGGFEEGYNVGHSWGIFANGRVSGWKTVEGELEVGWGRIYNPRWPAETHITELDANRNANVYQEFVLDDWNRIWDQSAE